MLDKSISIDIPANTQLEDALIEWGTKVGVTVMINTATASGQLASPVKGTLSAREALTQLLRGSGLSYARDGERIQIVSDKITDPKRTTFSYSASDLDKRFAYATDGATGSSDVGQLSETDDKPANRRGDLQEVIISAQKRDERLQDVPVPVTAIGADTLLQNNQVRIQDYYSAVPGLNFATGSQGDAFISIRGITTGPGNGNPTVGITLDDVPYGSSSTYGGLNPPAPDIDPGELARVEVLRGPQGTFYGASSIGGLLKFVTLDPSTSEVSGRVQAGVSSVYNGAELGYNVRGSVNIPISDAFAVRASAFTRQDPGYIDNVASGIDGINEVQVSGGRIAALWKPSDNVTLKLSGLLQAARSYGADDIDLGYTQGYAPVSASPSSYQQDDPANSGQYQRMIQAYSANLTAAIGSFQLTSLTGYNSYSLHDSVDLTPALGPYFATIYNGAAGATLPNEEHTEKVTEEVRVSAPLTSALEWLGGVFYTHESSHVYQDIQAVDYPSGTMAAVFGTAAWPTTYEEYALFTDLTYHITSQFDIQVGGRESQNRQAYSEKDIGYGGPDVIQPEIDTKDSSFTYLVTPTYKFSHDLMIYARLASGYRPGGPNATCVAYHVPCEFQPDKTENYDLGIKGDFFNHLISLDGSVYYINWKDIQVGESSGVSDYYANGSRAKSQGVELALESRPITGSNVQAWVAWNDAILTDAFPAASTVYGVAGDRLPFSAKFSGNVSVQQTFSLSNRVSVFISAAEAYVGQRVGGFPTSGGITSSLIRQSFPAYAQTDLRTGVILDSLSLNLSATNITNRLGELSGGLGGINPYAFQFTQPRTIGLSVIKTF